MAFRTVAELASVLLLKILLGAAAESLAGIPSAGFIGTVLPAVLAIMSGSAFASLAFISHAEPSYKQITG
jgi:hypothetical protein